MIPRTNKVAPYLPTGIVCRTCRDKFNPARFGQMECRTCEMLEDIDGDDCGTGLPCSAETDREIKLRALRGLKR